MSKYCYEKLNLFENHLTSSEDDNEYKDNYINNNYSSKKLKIKYIYTHYTNYTFYKKTSK